MLFVNYSQPFFFSLVSLSFGLTSKRCVNCQNYLIDRFFFILQVEDKLRHFFSFLKRFNFKMEIRSREEKKANVISIENFFKRFLFVQSKRKRNRDNNFYENSLKFLTYVDFENGQERLNLMKPRRNSEETCVPVEIFKRVFFSLSPLIK